MSYEFLVSIIIIVYNTNLDLLNRCLKSVYKYCEKFEIILIDDGSTIAGIKDLCQRYEHIKYVYKQNGGAGSARNEGLIHAKGKYILFVDSDDYLIDGNLFCLNFDDLSNDIIFLDYYVENNNKIIKHNLTTNQFNENDLSYKQFLQCLIGDYMLFGGYTVGAIWNKLFKRDYLLKNKLFFKNNIPKGQDVLFVIECLLKKPSLYYIKKAAYVYYVNNDSICHKPNDNLIKYYKIFLKELDSLNHLIGKRGIIDNQIIDICYVKAVINCIYSVLMINVLNPHLCISLVERKKKFIEVYRYFDNSITMSSIKLKHFKGIKEKMKVFCIKYKCFIILNVYQLITNR